MPTTKTMPVRDHGVTVTAAAAFLEVSRVTLHKYLSEGIVRRMGKTAQVSCLSLGAHIGYKASPTQIKQECLTALKAKRLGSFGS